MLAGFQRNSSTRPEIDIRIKILGPENPKMDILKRSIPSILGVQNRAPENPSDRNCGRPKPLFLPGNDVCWDILGTPRDPWMDSVNATTSGPKWHLFTLADPYFLHLVALESCGRILEATTRQSCPHDLPSSSAFFCDRSF